MPTTSVGAAYTAYVVREKRFSNSKTVHIFLSRRVRVLCNCSVQSCSRLASTLSWFPFLALELLITGLACHLHLQPWNLL
jgi:hypothetical protein